MPENGTQQHRPAGVEVAIPRHQDGRPLPDGVESIPSEGLRDIRTLTLDQAALRPDAL